MTDSLTKRDQPDRSKINMNEACHYWTKHLNISKEELQKAIDEGRKFSRRCPKGTSAVTEEPLDLWSQHHHRRLRPSSRSGSRPCGLMSRAGGGAGNCARRHAPEPDLAVMSERAIRTGSR